MLTTIQQPNSSHYLQHTVNAIHSYSHAMPDRKYSFTSSTNTYIARTYVCIVDAGTVTQKFLESIYLYSILPPPPHTTVVLVRMIAVSSCTFFAESYWYTCSLPEGTCTYFHQWRGQFIGGTSFQGVAGLGVDRESVHQCASGVVHVSTHLENGWGKVIIDGILAGYVNRW